MLRRIQIASLAVAFLFGISTLAWSQGRGGGGGASAFGGSSFGSGGLGSSGFGSSGLGSSGFGSSGFGSSGFGGSGFGSSGFGSGGFGGMGTGGSAFGNSGFGASGGYGGQGGGQAFVGRDGADMSAVMNQMGRAGTQFFNQMNRNARQSNRNNRNRQNPNANQAQPGPASNVRVKLELAFTPTRPASNALANTVRTRLTNILPDQGVTSPPDVTVEGGVVVLRGVAASENQRQVLERLVSFEPGVTSIRNEMTVAGAEDEK